MLLEISSPLADPAPEELRPPGWVSLGMEYTLAEPAKDPEVTRRIEALDPTFAPLGIRWVFLGPADAQTGIREHYVFSYHGIGRTSLALNTKGWSETEAQESMAILKIPKLEIPAGFFGRIPEYMDPTVGILDDPKFLGLPPVFQSPAEKYGAADLPGPFVPWDQQLFNALKSCYTSEHTVLDLKRSQLFNPLAERARKGEQKRKNFAQDLQGFREWAQKRINEASDPEIREFQQLQEQARQARLARMQAAFGLNFKLHGAS